MVTFIRRPVQVPGSVARPAGRASRDTVNDGLPDGSALGNQLRVNLLEVFLLCQGPDLIDGLVDKRLSVESRPIGDDAVVGGERSVDAANVVAIEGLGQ